MLDRQRTTRTDLNSVLVVRCLSNNRRYVLYTTLYDTAPELTRLTEHDLITWRQHMMTQDGLKAASINRRLEAVRRLLRWAEANGTVARNVALHVKSVRIVREPRPLGLRPHRCMACCVLPARVLTGSPGAITP